MATWKKILLSNGNSGNFVKGDGSFDTNTYSATNHSHSDATTSTAGFMTAADKSKLNNIAANATNVTNTNQLTNGAGFITGVTNISGNAGTATTLQTARNINGVSFNGSADITIADSTKLPLAGGTLTGRIYQTQTDNSTKTVWNSPGAYWVGLTGNVANNLSLVQYNSDNGAAANAVATYALLHAGNYNSYSPTLTGTGASGNWGINVTGSSGSVGVAATLNNTVTPSPGVSMQAGPGSSNGSYSWDFPYGTKLSAYASSGRGFEIMTDTYPDGKLYIRTSQGNNSWDSWKLIMDTTRYPYSANMNQNVRTTDNTTFASITTTGTATFAGNVTGANLNITNWNTAYSWGNHASAGYATTTYVDTSVANLVASAPATLNTLNELATALGSDANFSTTMTNSLANKLSLSGGTVSGNVNINGATSLTHSVTPLYIRSTTDDYVFISYSNAYKSWGMYHSGNNIIFRELGVQDAITFNAGGGLTLNGAISMGSIWISGTQKNLNWDTAYGWGNHASAGYSLTSHNHSGTYLPLSGGTISGTLDVSGAATLSSTLYANNTIVGTTNSNVNTQAGTSRVVIANPTFTSTRGLGFSVPDGTKNPRAWIQHITAADGTSQYIDFNSDYSGGTTYAKWIFSNGNVGIGTTSPSYKLVSDESGSSFKVAALSSSIGTVGTWIGYLYGYTGNTYQKGATFFESTSASGVGKFHIALNSAENSSNVSLSDSKLTIFSNGNTFIGSSSVDAGYKLDVNGTGRFSGAITLSNTSVNFRYSDAALYYQLQLGASANFKLFNANYNRTELEFIQSTGAATFSSSVTATSFVKSGGTSSQFLKADGTVDSNTYSTTAHNHSGIYQDADTDLTVIAGLSGTSGFLRKDATNSWSLDTNSYSTTSHNHSGTYLPMSGGTLTGSLIGTDLTLNTTNPIILTGNSQSGTYTRTVIYANQNNTSGNDSNGIFIERGKLTDAVGGETRKLVIGARGGAKQVTIDGTGNIYANGIIGINVPYSGADSHNLYLSNLLDGGYGTYPVIKTNFSTLYFQCQGTYTGYIAYNSGFVDVSDATLKTNVNIIPNALSKVRQLNGVSYNWLDGRDNLQNHYGVVAQQIEAIVPEVVENDSTGIKGVAYSGLTALCIEAIKELTNEVEALKLKLT